MTRIALLIVDMQKAYFRNEALEARKQALVEACNELRQRMVQRSHPVICIKTEHKSDTSTWTLNMKNDGEGYLFQGEAETAYVEGLDTSNAHEVTKTRDSAFFETDLASLLAAANVDHVIISGVSTHTCVFQTASDAYAHNIPVTLAKDTIASHAPQYETLSYEILKTEYRQQVLSNKDIINRFFF